MDTTLLSSSRKNTKVFSLKEKDFTYGIPLWKFITYGDEHSVKTTININPSSSAKGFMIDSFCERPAYVPVKGKRDPLYSDAKNYSLYFPLSDKLEGYNLYDVFYTEYVPAKGTFSVEDDNQYYELRNGAYRKKKNLEEGDKLNNYFLKTSGISLERNSKLSSNIYKNSTFTNSGYGEKINFFFDGIAPGSSDTSCNLLFNKELKCKSDRSNTSIALAESRSVYRTKSFDVLTDPEYNNVLYYEDIDVPNANVDGYTFSFIAKIDDYLSDNNVEDVNNRKEYNFEVGGVIKVFKKTSGSYPSEAEGPWVLAQNVVFSTDWKQYSVFIDNDSIKGETIKIAISLYKLNNVKIRTSAFMLNKGNYIASFDDRFHFVHDTPVTIQRKYPVLIDFLAYKNEDISRMPKTSSWTISYKRFINASPESEDLTKIDYLGNGLTFGYPFEDYDTSNFVGHIENVFIIYDAENLNLKYKVISDSSSIEKTYSFEEGPNFDSIVPDDTSVHFNIILGGYVEDGTIKVNNFTKYSDFMAFPYVLEEDEINKMSNTLMSVSFNSKAYSEHYEQKDGVAEGVQKYELRDNLTVLRSANFFETKNI